MGVGRREFLKAFGAAIASSAASPFDPVILASDYYINRALGLAFRKPIGWRCIDQRDFPRLRAAQLIEDGDISETLLSAADPYFVMAHANSAQNGALHPSMTAYAEEFYFEDGESLEVAPSLIARAMVEVLQDYELKGQSAVFQVSGVESIEYSARFRFVTAEINAPARCRSLLGVKGGVIFTFNFFDYPERGVDAQPEFDEIVDSLIYA